MDNHQEVIVHPLLESLQSAFTRRLFLYIGVCLECLRTLPDRVAPPDEQRGGAPGHRTRVARHRWSAHRPLDFLALLLAASDSHRRHRHSHRRRRHMPHSDCPLSRGPTESSVPAGPTEIGPETHLQWHTHQAHRPTRDPPAPARAPPRTPRSHRLHQSRRVRKNEGRRAQAASPNGEREPRWRERSSRQRRRRHGLLRGAHCFFLAIHFFVSRLLIGCKCLG